jgi:phage terminase large subunit GpA-like protein
MSLSKNITARQISNLQSAITAGLTSTLSIPEPISCADWSDKYFRLAAESSYSEGSWKTQPFQVAILNAMANDDIREVNLKKSARVGYSQMLKAAIAYFIEHKRRNCILWQPTNDKASEFTKEHIDTMIRDVSPLKKIFPWLDKKHKFNTLDYKLFTNSRQIHIKGGNSAANYREKSVDVAIYDELSSFDSDIDIEGDAITLGDKRVEGAPFPKSIRGSTPKELLSCQITIASDSADEHFSRYLPCPHCKEEQVLIWGGPKASAGIKFDKEHPLKAQYLCEHCSVLIDYKWLEWMDQNGIWRSQLGTTTHDGQNFYNENGEEVAAPYSVSFHIWAAYSPWTTWGKIARDFTKAKGSIVRWRSWTNTTEGQAYEEEGEKFEASTLYMRREHYPAIIPDDVCLLVAGIDTQDDRLECSIWGYGGVDGTESWLISHDIFYGNPSRMELWNRLRDHLYKKWPMRNGVTLKVEAAGIDTQGHNATTAYKFCKKHNAQRFYALKGSSQHWNPIVSRPTKNNKEKVNLFSVGTDTAKNAIFGCLKIDEPGPGYVHFPIGRPGIDEEYFEQITAEKLTTQYREGKPVKVYKQLRPRNEALDCKVYADVAIEILKPNFKILRSKLKKVLVKVEEPEQEVDIEEDEALSHEEPVQPVKKKKKIVKRKVVRQSRSKSSFAKRW